jgi:hypothetical protein
MVAGGRINRTFRVLRKYIKQGVGLVDKTVSMGVEVLDRAMSSFLPAGGASYRKPSGTRRRRRVGSRKH